MTKLKRILNNREITLQRLTDIINHQNPDLTISLNSVHSIASGKNKDYKLSTVYRICKALNITPNDVLDYENNI